MDQSTFANRIATLGLKNIEKALAFLWWSAIHDGATEVSVSEIRAFLTTHGLGSPSTTYLRTQLTRSRSTLKGKSGYRLSATGAGSLRERLQPVLDEPTQAPSDGQFLHESVWKPTRGYIERVCVQLNGCVHHGYYDAAAVMLRRVTETLLIEAYEAQKRSPDIQDSSGNYFMLGELVTRSTSAQGLALGREARTALGAIKSLGDRAAHNRRFHARRSDIDSLRSGSRVVFDELAALAGLR